MTTLNLSENKPEEHAAAPHVRRSERLGSWPGDANYEQKIAEAAYFNAERRGFMPGGELSDWLVAEAEVAAEMEAFLRSEN
ncbi:DUF2934 domain-containing protein [Propionivibrio sp.]|uniref:DUF2934 domain-containing protein n=1 Tax=Propionivibrio sp. TaxID=2212460 RepID=UPI003BF0C783